MHFLQPIWLAAMAGIVLPVVVHFWNDRRGKVLRIGSISLLEGASQRKAWSRRISDWWLLLLRCLLLMALPMLLAGPYWVPK
ncbi:MAG TPA: BatA domain-containing protein, partial [Puia sp.]|nr:BatA domain-containing protein [Puia sp.]